MLDIQSAASRKTEVEVEESQMNANERIPRDAASIHKIA
jgi:hypothetical protein